MVTFSLIVMGRDRRSKVAVQRDNVDEDEEIEIRRACLSGSKSMELMWLFCWLRGSGVVGGGDLLVVN